MSTKTSRNAAISGFTVGYLHARPVADRVVDVMLPSGVAHSVKDDPHEGE
jgi:hypothetical protein